MKVMLMCAAGMSTSLLVTKMLNYAKEIGREDIIIDAKPVDELDDEIENYDFFLLGPQIRYKEKVVRDKLKIKGKRCGVIPAEVYGRIDGKRALDIVINEYEKK